MRWSTGQIVSKKEIKSPCIKKCKLVGTVCSGCGRTIDEIIEAGKAYNEQRRKKSSRHACQINSNGRGPTRAGS